MAISSSIVLEGRLAQDGEWESWGPPHVTHAIMVCGQVRPFAEHVEVEQVCSREEWDFAHHRQAEALVHRSVWCPNCWQLVHCVKRLNFKRRLTRKVFEKAQRRDLEAKSWALGPVAIMVTVDADFPDLLSSVVSHLGCSARARPVL